MPISNLEEFVLLSKLRAHLPDKPLLPDAPVAARSIVAGALAWATAFRDVGWRRDTSSFGLRQIDRRGSAAGSALGESPHQLTKADGSYAIRDWP